MKQQHLRRTPLVAVIGLLAFLVIPAAAQAHHINTTASCAAGSNGPVVTYKVEFIQFSSGAKPTTNGTVKVEGTTVKNVPNPDKINWSQEPGTLSGTTPGKAGQQNEVVADFYWTGGGHQKQTVKTNTCPSVNPGIKIVKDGPSTRYVGDQATFTYKVTNTGNVKLSEPVVTDDKCSPVVKVTQQSAFDPGDVWDYTCTLTITDAMGDQLVNVAKACAEYPGKPKVCDEDDHKTDIPKPAIALDKTGATTAAAGSTFTYTFKATNIGNVTLTNVVLTDDKCQATLTRSEPNLADTTFDKGDEWFYTCTVIAPAGPAQVDNLAKVCGDYDAPDVDMRTVCAEDTHTFTVPPPGTPPNTPPSTPPSSTPTPPTGDSGVLPETVASGRAVLRGPSGCVKQAFRARVRGRSIASVTFFVDGRRVKRITGTHASYSLKVRPSRYGFGRHTIIARVEFIAASGTQSRRLPLTFRRCAQGTVAPRFTG
jgi:hypothetical protein